MKLGTQVLVRRFLAKVGRSSSIVGHSLYIVRRFLAKVGRSLYIVGRSDSEVKHSVLVGRTSSVVGGPHAT